MHWHPVSRQTRRRAARPFPPPPPPPARSSPARQHHSTRRVSVRRARIPKRRAQQAIGPPPPRWHRAPRPRRIPAAPLPVVLLPLLRARHRRRATRRRASRANGPPLIPSRTVALCAIGAGSGFWAFSVCSAYWAGGATTAIPLHTKGARTTLACAVFAHTRRRTRLPDPDASIQLTRSSQCPFVSGPRSPR